MGQHDLIISSLKKAVLLAAEFGTVEVIDLCLQSYPEVFWCHYPTTYYTMLHVAVIHRQVEVFRLLQKYKAPRNNLARWKDHSTENNILHLAAKLAPSTVLKSVSGTALQMQRELQWYKVIIPTPFKSQSFRTPTSYLDIQFSNDRSGSSMVTARAGIGCLFCMLLTLEPQHLSWVPFFSP